jgi:hypothetical protein
VGDGYIHGRKRLLRWWRWGLRLRLIGNGKCWRGYKNLSGDSKYGWRRRWKY